jgi:hypothetical protein
MQALSFNYKVTAVPLDAQIDGWLSGTKGLRLEAAVAIRAALKSRARSTREVIETRINEHLIAPLS